MTMDPYANRADKAMCALLHSLTPYRIRNAKPHQADTSHLAIIQDGQKLQSKIKTPSSRLDLQPGQIQTRRYIAQYRERIEEVEAVQKRLWDIIEGQTAPPTKVEACGNC